MASVADLRQILKEDSAGKNLYDHLTETLMKILLEKPANAFDNFELISAEVKSNPLNPDPEKGRPIDMNGDELNKKQAWTDKCTQLFKPNDEPPEATVKYEDSFSAASYLEWAGISFGKGETYRLFLSIKRLAESGKIPAEAERLRFFGKFNTRGAPYFVLESFNPEEPEIADPTKMEGKAGANKYAYWVAQGVDVLPDEWVKLPNVTSAQVIVSRKFKRLLTGNLDAEVCSYPPFPGKEKEFLRTQIALIASATLISPDGFFAVDEDSDPPGIKPAEAEQINENFPKSSSDFLSPDAWKHHEFALNPIGRVTKLPDPGDEGDAVEVEGNEASAPLDVLKENAWAFRVCPGGAGTAAGSAVVAKSLVWPGAVAIASRRRYMNVYVGNGVIFDGVPYSPPLPQPVQTEFVATEDFPLTEMPDPKVDPTPPVPEGDGAEE